MHLELVESQKLEEFIICFKRFVARRGRPQKVYSDNAKTFKAAANWIKTITESERFQDYLSEHCIKWQFNLSRAPWWGGQFERMVGLMKQCLYKSVGKANLKWSELEEVLLDIENTLNNRPLCYLEDDVQFPVVTPNTLTFGEDMYNLNDDISSMNGDLRKRAKYIRRCKRNAWKRWKNEYLKSLRERHNMQCKKQKLPQLLTGDVVIIEGPERNRNHWTIGIVDSLIVGKDGVTRAAKIRTGRTTLERAIQQLYPLELRCDNKRQDQIESGSEEFVDVENEEKRSPRNAAAIARLRLRDQAEEELSETF